MEDGNSSQIVFSQVRMSLRLGAGSLPPECKLPNLSLRQSEAAFLDDPSMTYSYPHHTAVAQKCNLVVSNYVMYR